MNNDFQSLVKTELAKVRKRHKPFNSVHEGFGVLLEEVDELWEEVRKKRSKRDRANMLRELIQIASVAQRFAEDLT